MLFYLLNAKIQLFFERNHLTVILWQCLMACQKIMPEESVFLSGNKKTRKCRTFQKKSYFCKRFWGCSSVGRALGSQSRGREFESRLLHSEFVHHTDVEITMIGEVTLLAVQD